jgi:hypothetical protein
MLTFEPRANERLWIVYAADTSGSWLEPDGGLRSAGAGHWVATTGGLSPAEAEALRALQARLSEPDRHAVIRPARDGELPSGPAGAAVAALEPLAGRVFGAAEAVLRGWEAALRDQSRPAWFEPMRAALVRFMGADPDRTIAVHLLPCGAEANGRLWSTFVGVGHRGLQCGGPAFRHDRLLEDLLHTAAHSAQPARLDPLLDAFLATPEGRDLDARFRSTPYGVRLREIPEIEDAGPRDLLWEYVVHALVYEGALREAGGLPAMDEYWRDVQETAHRVLDDPATPLPPGGHYAVWVLGGCAALQPAAREYLRAGRPLDEAFVRRAVAVFDDLYDRWQRPVPARTT